MIATLLVVIGVLSRVLPHTSQFTALLAVSLFAGMYLDRRMSLVVPVAVLILTDVLLGFHDTMIFTYGSVLLISTVGIYLRERKNWFTVVMGALTSAGIFFVITNFGAFLTLYPQTWEGLVQCYTLAIPFWRSTVVSTVAYSVVFYACYEWLLSHRGNPVIARFL